MSAVTARDRLAFLLAVDRVEPEVFKSLTTLRKPLLKLGSRGVGAWLKRWHLDIPGLEWIEEGVLRGEISFPAPLAAGWDGHGMELTLIWEPGESGKDRVTFMAEAHQALDAYAAKVEEWARDQGIPVHRERKRGARPGVRRWDILARRIVLAAEYPDIAKDLGRRADGGIDRAAARRHCIALAKRLGVTLPP